MAPAENRRPTVRHRTLSAELRRLREAAELTRDEVGARLDCSASTIMRWETGRWKRIQSRDLRPLLDIYGVTKKNQREAYIKMAKDAKEQGWWIPYSDILKGAYVGFEDAASEIQDFEPAYVPGLLQTEEYARALLWMVPAADPDQVDRKVALRLERQKLLRKDDAPQTWVVIDEPVVRRLVGGTTVMRAQLRHLVSEAEALPNLELQVLPLSAGAHAGMDGAFTVLSFPDPEDLPVIYIETATDGNYPEGSQVLNWYRLIFDHLQAVALSMSESLAFIDQVAKEL